MSRLALVLLLSLGAFVCEAKLRSAGIRLGASPGIVVRLRKAALDSFFGSITSLSSRYAPKLPIPDVSASVSGVDLETSDVRISRFDQPKIIYRLSPPNAIAGSLEFPHVGIEGPFKATRRTVFGSQHDAGHATFNASQAFVNFTAVLGEHDNGIPRVDKFECASSLGPANLNVKNAKEKFAVEVLGLAAKSVRPLYNTQVCATAKKIVSGQLNKLLGKLPNVLDISSKISFKYQVKPVVGQDFLEARLFGKVITDIVSPHSPAPFVVADDSDAMVTVLISDAVFNDVLYQIYSNELLKCKIDKNSQPVVYDVLRIDPESPSDVSLGNIAPNLKAKYGSDAVTRLEFKASKAPEVEFQQGKAVFSAGLVADLYFTPSNDTLEYHDATVQVEVTGSLKIRVHENVIYGQANAENVVVHLDQINNKDLEKKAQETAKKIVDNYINSQLLLKGLPLKLPFGAGFSDPLVSFQPHTLQLHSGFEYKPFTSAEKK